MLLSIKPYPQIRSLVLTNDGLGSAHETGYYFEQGGFITIVLSEAQAECEFPTAETFDQLPPDFTRTFRRDWEADFREKIAQRLRHYQP